MPADVVLLIEVHRLAHQSLPATASSARFEGRESSSAAIDSPDLVLVYTSGIV